MFLLAFHIRVQYPEMHNIGLLKKLIFILPYILVGLPLVWRVFHPRLNIYHRVISGKLRTETMTSFMFILPLCKKHTKIPPSFRNSNLEMILRVKTLRIRTPAFH